MKLSRKKLYLYAFLSAIIYVINYIAGKEIWAFVGRYIVYWCVSLAAAGTFAYFIVNIVFKAERKKSDGIIECPYEVEPKDEEV